MTQEPNNALQTRHCILCNTLCVSRAFSGAILSRKLRKLFARRKAEQKVTALGFWSETSESFLYILETLRQLSVLLRRGEGSVRAGLLKRIEVQQREAAALAELCAVTHVQPFAKFNVARVLHYYDVPCGTLICHLHLTYLVWRGTRRNPTLAEEKFSTYIPHGDLKIYSQNLAFTGICFTLIVLEEESFFTP